jgi:hypothetical protein
MPDDLDAFKKQVLDMVSELLREHPTLGMEVCDWLRDEADRVEDRYAWTSGPWMEPRRGDVLRLTSGHHVTVIAVLEDEMVAIEASLHVVSPTPLQTWQHMCGHAVKKTGASYQRATEAVVA